MNPTLTLTKWLAPAAALLLLAGTAPPPVEAGRALRRTQDVRAPREEAPPEPAESVVRGRAVYDDTSRPVRRARVMLLTENDSERREYAALTDGRGGFELRGVRAGTYYAFVDVPGALSPVGFNSIEEIRAAGGPRNLGEGRKYFDRVEVDGKQDLTLTVHARRGASLAGRVSYADGDPAVNVSVTLMRRDADGRVNKYLTGANLVALSGLRTDDRGMFRLMGLPPGEYLIGISEAVNHGTAGGDAGSMGDDIPGSLRGMFTQPLLMTYYPSATNVKEAGTVKVEAGDERADVDITIPERDLRTVSGVVRSRRGGVPLRGARVTITRREDSLLSNRLMNYYYEPPESPANITETDAEGRWQFREIPDGPYTIDVKPPEEYEAAPTVTVDKSASATSPGSVEVTTAASTNGYRPPRRIRSYAPASRNCEVSGSDVSEFVVEVVDGARITGVVTIEGKGEPRYGYVSVSQLDEAGAGALGSAASHVSLDRGQFAIEGLPAGRFVLQPSVSGASVYLKSMTWNGKDLLHEPLALAEGAEASGVRVVFAPNPATLNVNVRAGAGRPAGDVVIALVPADLSSWLPDARPTVCVTRGTNGCSVVGPPGEYRVVAIRRVMGRAQFEQEVRSRAATAPHVTLREGETEHIQLDAPD